VEQDAQTTDYLYDFFYVDRPRLSSFLSHFENDGVVTATKETIIKENLYAQDSDVSGGLPVIKGKIAAKSQQVTKEQYEHTFDPTLILPINALETLDQHGFIERDISRATLGQLVLVKGSLSIVDFRLLQKHWDIFEKLLLESELEKVEKNKRKSEELNLKKKMNNIHSLMKLLPHTLTCHLVNNNTKVFSIFNLEHLRVQLESLILSQGANLKGEWSLIGLVDAIPDMEEGESELNSANPLVPMLSQISGVAREILGRSNDAYAITPVCIYRTVTKNFN
jgi:hypothetical protein